MTAAITFTPACITGLQVSHDAAEAIVSHLKALSNTAECDYRNDLNSFATMLEKAILNWAGVEHVRIGLVAHGAQWLMYAVQNAASDNEPADISKAREEVFTAIKTALDKVGVQL